MDLKVFLAALGLSEGATAEQVTDFAVAAERTKIAYAKLLASIGVAVGASAADIDAALGKFKAAADDLTRVLATLKVKSADEAVGMVAALQANNEHTDIEGHARLLGALGAKSVDEAMGVIAGHQANKERLAVVEASLSSLTGEKTKSERDEIIAKLELDHKCSPVQKEKLFPTLSLEGLKAFAATAVPIFASDNLRQPEDATGTYKGKKYADMTNMERHALSQSNPTLFAQLRDAADAQ
jgi:hypothetical protein